MAGRVTEPWIRVHANLAAKPVVIRAVEALGVSQHEAIGLLVQFWGAVSQHVTDGLVGPHSDTQLEVWAGWTKKKGRFAAFVRSAHLDRDGRVNEWEEYAGALEEQRRQARTRKRRSRVGHAENRDSHSDSHSDSHGDGRVTSSPTKRNDNDTIRNEPVVDDDRANIPGEPELTGLFLTICANRAITERWAEQIHPLTPASAIELAAELTAEGIPADFARLSIYRQARECKLAKPPRSVNYFASGIRSHWAEEQARRAMIASGEVPPPVANATPVTGVRRESWKDADERREREEGERRLIRDRSGNVEQRRAADDGSAWWARMQRDAKVAKVNPVLYAFDRLHEPGWPEAAHV